MKFTCNSKEISAALGAAGKIVNAHTTVPILSNVLLSAHDGKIAVRATDLEVTLEHAFAAEVSEAGSVTVPAKLFAGYLGNLPAGVLEFTGSSSQASVKCERSNYNFHALPADEFPPLPTAARGESFTLGAKTFRDAVGATIFAASGEEARGAVLMGTLLEVEGETVTLVATDGYRLAKRSVKLEHGVTQTARYIVPSRALAETARNLGGAENVEIAALGAQNNQLRCSAGDVAITVRLVDGQYPNYQQVIPANFDRSITVSTAALIAALRRAGFVAIDRASMVRMTISDQTATVTATSDSTGSAHEEIEVEQHGEELSIAFNARYLEEILSRIESDRAVIEFLGPLSPASIRPEIPTEGAQQLYVLMPLRQ